MTQRIALEDRSAKFDVALSFAGEDRAFVGRIANALVARGILVFYDEFYKVDLLGKELVTWLRHIYGERSRYCAVFVSENYSRKRWTNRVERQTILDRATQSDDEYVLPVVLDNAWLEGLPSTIGFIDGRNSSESEVADLIAGKCGGARTQLNELETFRTLAADDSLIGRFLWLFGQSDEFSKDHYDGATDTIRKAVSCTALLETYALCTAHTNYPEADLDVYIEATLSDKGKRFKDYIAEKFLPRSKIDYPAEKLSHALMLLVPLRARIGAELPEKDKMSLTCSIEDLAKGVADYCLSRMTDMSGDAHNSKLRTFIRDIRECKSRDEVIAAFAAVDETRPYWCVPYFDSRDLSVLDEARRRLGKEF